MTRIAAKQALVPPLKAAQEQPKTTAAVDSGPEAIRAGSHLSLRQSGSNTVRGREAPAMRGVTGGLPLKLAAALQAAAFFSQPAQAGSAFDALVSLRDLKTMDQSAASLADQLTRPKAMNGGGQP